MVVDVTAALRKGQKRFDFRREYERVGAGRVIERLYSQSISGTKQFRANAIPDREREHSLEPTDARLSPFDIRVQQHLGVSSRDEAVSSRLQLRSELLVIVDFAIEDDPRSPVRGTHWLEAALREVKYREAAMPQPDTYWGVVR